MGSKKKLVVLLLITLFLTIPIVSLIFSISGIDFDNFNYLWDYLLIDYSLNTTFTKNNDTNNHNFFNAHKENALLPTKSSLNSLVSLTDVLRTSGETTPGYSTHFFKKFAPLRAY